MDPSRTTTLELQQLAAVLRARKERLIERWLERVTHDPTLVASGQLTHLVLRNHMPELIDRLIEALERQTGQLLGGEARGRATGVAAEAHHHAEGRRAGGYSLAAVLRELSHFRAAVIELCRAEGIVLVGEEALLVHAALDEGAALVAVEMESAGLASLRQDVAFREQLLGIVSHDLRNPINAMIGSAALLLRRESLDERAAKALARIVSSGQRATRLIRDLLDFTQSRLGGGLLVERRDLDLHELTQQVVDEVALAHPARALLIERQGDGRAACDADRVAQVITNLVTNALTYSPGGTPVRVRTRGERDAVVLEVHNEGPPIPPEQLPSLFEPMRRGAAPGDRAEHSVGLGLFIVREVVRAHGGAVDVHSTAADGTSFRVHWPREAAPAEAG